MAVSLGHWGKWLTGECYEQTAQGYGDVLHGLKQQLCNDIVIVIKNIYIQEDF